VKYLRNFILIIWNCKNVNMYLDCYYYETKTKKKIKFYCSKLYWKHEQRQGVFYFMIVILPLQFSSLNKRNSSWGSSVLCILLYIHENIALWTLARWALYRHRSVDFVSTRQVYESTYSYKYILFYIITYYLLILFIEKHETLVK